MLGQERRQIRATLIGAPVRFQLVFGFVNAIRLTWDGGMMLCTPDVLPRMGIYGEGRLLGSRIQQPTTVTEHQTRSGASCGTEGAGEGSGDNN
jgi:hypothetical protein